SPGSSPAGVSDPSAVCNLSEPSLYPAAVCNLSKSSLYQAPVCNLSEPSLYPAAAILSPRLVRFLLFSELLVSALCLSSIRPLQWLYSRTSAGSRHHLRLGLFRGIFARLRTGTKGPGAGENTG